MNILQESVLCAICDQPVALELHHCSNEEGKAVHEACHSRALPMKKPVASSDPIQSKFDCFA
jgi:hypothetical protein